MQKITLSACLLLLFAMQLHAQFQNKQLSANINFTNSFLRNHIGTGLQSSINIGLSEHSTIGAFADYNWENTSSLIGTGYKQVNKFYGTGVIYTYAHNFRNSAKWGWYGTASTGFYWNNSFLKDPNNNMTGTVSRNISIDISDGLFYSASKRVMFFAGLNLLDINKEIKNPRGINFSMPLQASIGVIINLGNSKRK